MTHSSAVTVIADDVYDFLLDTNPRLRSRNGLPVKTLRGCDIESVERDAAFAARSIEALSMIDRSALSHQDRLTAMCLDHSLSTMAQAPSFSWYDFDVTPYAAPVIFRYLDDVLGRHPLDSPEDGQRYLDLVTEFTRVVRGLRRKLDGQLQRGIRLAKPALSGARETIYRLRRTSGEVVVPAAERLRWDGGSEIAARARRLLDDELFPAFDEVLEFLAADSSAGPPGDVGLMHLPGGEEAYRYAIRRYTSMDLEPDDVHRLGLDQVALLSDQMAESRGRLGFAGTEAEFHRALAANPDLYARSADEVEERYLAHLARIEPNLDKFFAALPRAPYAVTRLDPALEAGMTYGYYSVPSANDAVGRYRYNGSTLTERSMLTSASLIYHELVPGHHFHLARQLESDTLHPLRQGALDFDTYDEGWAEYASGLSAEMDGYPDPYDAYGRLVHERLTAVRLVVDTGLNALGWTLEEARRYMRETTLESDEQIGTETLRYGTALPGQALGYRLGYLAFRDLRTRTERTVGAEFSLPHYHDAILTAGALPIPALDYHLTTYAETVSAATPQPGPGEAASR